MTDQQFQEQLVIAEHLAPTGVWKNVAAVLEEDAEDATQKRQLILASVSPPSFIWNNIELELEEAKHDEQLATSINQNKVTAPALLWENIEELLDADADKVLADTINSFEVQAPAYSWNFIENELHPPAKIISITKRYTPIYRMAAAAVVIGFVTWGVFQFLPKQATQAAYTQNTPTPKKVPTPPDTNLKPAEPFIAVIEPKSVTPSQANNLIALYKPKQVKKIASDEVMQHDKPSTKKTDFSETNYLLVLNDNGDLIRVSKKLSSMDCAKNNELPVDAITALQAKDCDAQIKKLQQRMATSLMGSIVDPITLTNSTDK